MQEQGHGPRLNGVEALQRIERLSRRRFLKISVSGAAVVLTPGLLAACGNSGGAKTSSSSATKVKEAFGGTGTGAFAGQFGTFDPAFATAGPSIAVNVHVFEPLVEQLLTSARPYRPALAATMPERVDDTHYRVRLRDGAVFHDGSPVTSEDVVYTFKRILKPAKGQTSFFAPIVSPIVDVTADDERTVSFKLSTPTPSFEAHLFPSIVPKSIVERVGPDQFGNKPVGSGPYTFTSVSGSRITLTRFKRYHGPRPGHLDTIDFTFVDDAPARVASLRSGGVNVIADVPDRDFTAMANDQTLATAREYGYLGQFLMFNCNKAPFNDKRVRQAFWYGLDRDMITKVAFKGNAKVADSQLPPNHPAHVTPSQTYPYDPERAKALLRAAGVPNGFHFKLQVSNLPWIEASSTIARQNWSDLGLKVDVLVGGEEIYNHVYDGSYQVQLSGGDPSVFGWDPGILLGWHYGPVWRNQLYYWKGPEATRMQQLLNKGSSSTSPRAAQPQWAEIQNIAAENVPLMFTHHRTANTAWSTTALDNVTPLSAIYLDMRTAQQHQGA